MKDNKRFTERDEFGNADIIGVDGPRLVSNLDFDEITKLTCALNKLADFEDKKEHRQKTQNITDTTINFTEKDKILALKYKNAGYLFVVRDRDGSILICRDLPEKRNYGMFEFWIVWEAKRIGKSHFKPVRFTDKNAITLDSITESKQ